MSRSHHPNSKSARLWATRFAALLAVFLQVFVVQTHVHARVPASAAGYEQTSSVDASHVEAAHHAQVACALCQIQASSRALTPSAATLEAVETTSVVEPTIEIRPVEIAPSHSWQSRAPPTLL